MVLVVRSAGYGSRNATRSSAIAADQTADEATALLRQPQPRDGLCSGHHQDVASRIWLPRSAAHSASINDQSSMQNGGGAWSPLTDDHLASPDLLERLFCCSRGGFCPRRSGDAAGLRASLEHGVSVNQPSARPPSICSRGARSNGNSRAPRDVSGVPNLSYRFPPAKVAVASAPSRSISIWPPHKSLPFRGRTRGSCSDRAKRH